ncbi:MAG: excinuclease ABC subunit UvrA [Polyangia bacterium]
MSSMLPISLRGAKTHNLQSVDLQLSAGTLVALCGPSGAGKSSLALDTLYAEGQRRFVESFSPYARQFLERLPRPDVDSLEPVAAAVAVDRRAPVKSSRSTLATLTDVEPYLSALFAAEAVPSCPTCQLAATVISPVEAAARVSESHSGRSALIVFPIGTSEEARLALPRLREQGFRRLLLDEELFDVEADALPDAAQVHVVVDRLVLSEQERSRLCDALELCHRYSTAAEVRLIERGGQAKDAGARNRYTQAEKILVGKDLHCPGCARTFEPPHARLFSYNSPLGACPACRGFGRMIGIDWDKVIPDGSKSILKGAIKPWSGQSSQWERAALVGFAEKHRVPLDKPWDKLTPHQQKLILDGEGTWDDGKYPGVRAWFQFLESRTYKMHVRVLLSRYRAYELCAVCHGARLNPTALSYRVGQKNLAEWHADTVATSLERLSGLSPRSSQGKLVIESLHSRLGFLSQVGLGYLQLDRQARTLSGGEAQRASLTTALGAGLTGTLFVLDEPSVGLHPTDVPKLGDAMRSLARGGNTVLLIEHEPSLIAACDRAIELGPKAGRHGGRVLFDGPPKELASRPDLPTGAAWQKHKQKPRQVRPIDKVLSLRGVSENNLCDVDVDIPLGMLVAVTGPSGSGKSTLVEDVLYRAVARQLGDSSVDRPGAHKQVSGTQALKNVVLVDQSPLGRTTRGNAATYTKAWDRFRTRLAAQASALSAGLTASHFSFNVAKGRCETCSGEGYETVEMQFLADVSLLCPVCQGKRFRPEVLTVKLLGLHVAEILKLSIEEALLRFDPKAEPDPALRRALAPLLRVGLGYLTLGQPLSTLSGGEAQRLKLARALSEPARNTLFVIDEPSAGLHPLDVEPVVAALHALCENGGSVVVVEHDLDVIAQADWVIDLGPGGGPDGGRIVAEATPAELARLSTRTGTALKARQLSTLHFADEQATAQTQEAVISVERAREHNLRGISCKLPHGGLSVVTGPSGSGKSSLCFDVIYAEGQRRFMETLSPYARQFLPQLPRPDVDSVAGVPPAIALSQRVSRAGANSTVATVTEVAHYLRLLYAKVGVPYCPNCDEPAQATSTEALMTLFAHLGEAPHTLYAAAVRGRKGTYLEVFQAASKAGLKTARVDGKLVAIDPPPRLLKTAEHHIDLIVAQGRPSLFTRAEIDLAIQLGDGNITLAQGITGSSKSSKTASDERSFSVRRACAKCGLGIPELDPRWFSFNTKQGQCEACEGRGHVPDDESKRCRSCQGTRLAPLPRKVRLQGHTYAELTAHSVQQALSQVETWRFQGGEEKLSAAPLHELLRRLRFIDQVGLGYLSLDRAAATLSGGEMQRLRLSAQLGAGLTGALYVLDEPTIGLHPRDTFRLLRNLRSLADLGSTVLVIEHDEATIRAADYLLDLGPSGGKHGGSIIAQGPAAVVLKHPDSPTAHALAEPMPTRTPRPLGDKQLSLRGASVHNLKNVTLKLPIGRFNVVAGVSGSGKSTLVQKVLYPTLRKALGLSTEAPLGHAKLDGIDSVRRALLVDQSPIGRTPRSVPATFLSVWDEIRRLYASLPDAKVRGFAAGRFSFNSAGGGRCPTCEGQGVQVSEMSFLPDVITPCEACAGQRFEPATLAVRFQGLTIGDVLMLSAEEAVRHFANHPKIMRPLSTLCELGIGYIQLGQGSHTLSGGEAQRLKLAAELTALQKHEPTVYVLDEPTTGLHLSDARRLIALLHKLVDRGDTLVIVEHHLEMIAAADWVVELGPEAGESGGEIVFAGPPMALARANTATGESLAQAWAQRPAVYAATSSRTRSDQSTTGSAIFSSSRLADHSSAPS